VFVRIVVQDLTDVLVVPLGALFRLQDVWTVYVIENGTAVLRSVELGHRNTEHAAVLKGLSTGERVVLHPSDRIADGVSIVERADLN
jgi:HlyD family secretion protein